MATLLTTLCLLGALLAGGSPASADVSGTGWHISEFGYDQLHARGIDGSGVTVAVFEYAIDLNSPDFEGADIEFIPLPPECTFPPINGFEGDEFMLDHGTSVASMIVGQGAPGRIQGVAPRASLKVYQTPPQSVRPGDSEWPAACDPLVALDQGRAMQAERDGVDIISVSHIGGGELPVSGLSYLLMRQVAYFSGAGNTPNSSSATGANPGGVQVTAVGPGGTLTDWASRGQSTSLAAPGLDLPNRDPKTGKLYSGRGTSLSAPIVAGTFALGRQAWPKATNHQLMQALARNSRNGNPDLVWQSPEIGYGIIDPVSFIEADPSQYPDEHPFTHKENSDPEWRGVQSLLIGADRNDVVSSPQHYIADAGIDPAAILWVPENLKDLVGTAPDVSYWESVPDPVPAGPYAYLSNPGGQSQQSESSGLTSSPAGRALLVLGIPLLLVVVVLLVVLLLVRRRKKAVPVMAAGHPPMMHPPGYAPQQGFPPHGAPGQAPPPPPGYGPPPGDSGPGYGWPRG